MNPVITRKGSLTRNFNGKKELTNTSFGVFLQRDFTKKSIGSGSEYILCKNIKAYELIRIISSHSEISHFQSEFDRMYFSEVVPGQCLLSIWDY
eukprot:snap_masked-scaffold_8-processed-gene-7.38-mRNA-1 protein AED:1.00 eAED:1.00 QI:0/0/0/0/1/1/2/0/93